jgi:signal transduction histidine kinase
MRAVSRVSASVRLLMRRASEAVLRVPVFAKVMGIVLSMAAAFGSGLLWQIHTAWHQKAIGDLVARGEFLTRHVTLHAEPYLRGGRLGELERLMNEVRANAQDIVGIAVVASDGRVSVFSGNVEPAPEMRLLTADLPPDLGGHVEVKLSTASVDHSVGWLTGRLARTTAAIALIGILASWGLTRLITRPLEELVNLAWEVQDGQYGGTAPVRVGDEIGELATAFNEMSGALAEKERAGQVLRRQVLAAQEEERRRVARELHDETGQALTSLIAGLGALEAKEASAGGAGPVVELRRMAEQTLQDVHDLAVTLRPSVLDDVGLVPAVERHCATVEARFGLPVSFRHLGMEGPRLRAEMEVAIYRLIQEAVTNAVRHGRARTVHVLLEREDRRVLLVVADDGRGFAANTWRTDAVRGGHLGLRGMEERVQLFGGSFCVDSGPGAGTLVWAQMPVEDMS